MTKTFSDKGINGEFTGKIQVTFDARSETIPGQNHSTHEYSGKTIYYNKVAAFVERKKIDEKDFCKEDENDLLHHLAEIEQVVKHQLRQLAHVAKKPTFVDKLKKLGYS